MNILLIGSGGREHALAWKLSQSPLCDKLYCAPGNPGIAHYAQVVKIGVEDVSALAEFIKTSNIDFVVVGPEAALMAGIADACLELGVPCFGPVKAAARIEGSKSFMKDVCSKAGVPTAQYQHFTDVQAAKTFIQTFGTPLVVKADGLAAGKGVIICNTTEEAINAATFMMEENAFGEAGQEIVIEEFMDGEEVSYFAICDGKSVLPFGSAQDHKRAYDGDTGPNTGGMGAYSPARLMTPALEEEILTTCIQPIVDAMAAAGTPFTGVLFAGLMIKDGRPRVLEYNARFGDPECQVLMTRLKSDLADLLYKAATGKLHEVSAQWSDDPAITVVMAAEGYPEAYKKDTVIDGLAAAEAHGARVFHAGTGMKDGRLVSVGGRVLNVTASAATISAARDLAYTAIADINWPQGFYRKDIGHRALG